MPKVKVYSTSCVSLYLINSYITDTENIEAGSCSAMRGYKSLNSLTTRSTPPKVTALTGNARAKVVEIPR